MKDFKSSDGDESVGDIGGKGFQIVEEAVFELLRGLQRKGDHQQMHHLVVTLTAAAAAIQVAAKIMSAPHEKTEEEFMAWSEQPADRTAVLAAALLVSRCMLPCKEGVNIEFTPTNILAAVEAVKKVTGNDDTSVLSKQMMAAVKKFATPAHFFDNTRDSFGDLGFTVH